MAEEAGQAGGDQHPQGAQEYGLDGHRAGCLPLGSETAVEHDDDQGGGADLLREGVVLKVDAEQPVGAEEHAQGDEEKQGGDTEAAGEFVAGDAGDHHDGAQKKQ